MSRRSVPSFSEPRFMTDWSFMATIGPGSATATLRSGVPVARIVTGVALAAAQVCESTCRRSVGSSGNGARSASVTSRTSTCTGPADVGTRTPDAPLGLAPLVTRSSSCAGSSLCRRFTVSRSLVARYGRVNRQTTANPPTTMTSRPVRSVMAGIARASADIDVPTRSTTVVEALPDTRPDSWWGCPSSQNLTAAIRVLS